MSLRFAFGPSRRFELLRNYSQYLGGSAAPDVAQGVITAEAEQFAISLADIKRLVPRLKSLKFQLHYPELVQDCKPDIVAATEACQEVIKCISFQSLSRLEVKGELNPFPLDPRVL